MIRPIDYKHSIVNLMASIIKYYGGTSKYQTLKKVDEYLNKNYRNVVLLILDGLGDEILKYNSEFGILSDCKIDTIDSVYPPTTVAATTSFTTGLAPIEHGCLGWSLFISEFNETIDVFRSRTALDNNSVEFDLAKTMNNRSIFSIIKEGTFDEVERYQIFPKGITTEDRDLILKQVEDVEEFFGTIAQLSTIDTEKYIYAYWPNPDSIIHKVGTKSVITKHTIEIIETQIERIYSNLDDTLLIITGDHGLIDIEKTIELKDYPKIVECFSRMPDIENRTLNFVIKDNKKKQFAFEFKKQFSDVYDLYTKEEVLDGKLFGDFEKHPRIDDFLGDYVALAKGKTSLIYQTPAHDMVFKAYHAGITDGEVKIPLIIIDKKKREF